MSFIRPRSATAIAIVVLCVAATAFGGDVIAAVTTPDAIRLCYGGTAVKVDDNQSNSSGCTNSDRTVSLYSTVGADRRFVPAGRLQTGARDLGESTQSDLLTAGGVTAAFSCAPKATSRLLIRSTGAQLTWWQNTTTSSGSSFASGRGASPLSLPMDSSRHVSLRVSTGGRVLVLELDAHISSSLLGFATGGCRLGYTMVGGA